MVGGKLQRRMLLEGDIVHNTKAPLRQKYNGYKLKPLCYGQDGKCMKYAINDGMCQKCINIAELEENN
jgi:hypothetical protein